ncbi:DUF6545 domain-containing protein [Streptomyces gobiensis]|uniref:DUF6545 domain-containing protein n=1 Tax=Streptomyces gobiensis TaxID=2875706 RepID=UPI001E5C9B81|nr:DUF6545 domain-containing protein [Streptomyces gobiensis]UGY91962.1 hypothetical protein test1122_09680 [Streptomyces gobiensis]
MPKTSRRARCEAVADALDFPRPFDLDVLCDRIAAESGRPLRLVALDGAPDGELPSGVWVATSTTDVIFYEPATSAVHRLQIILHELAHLLLGHGEPDAERPAYTTRLLGEAGSGALAEDDELDLDQLRDVFGVFGVFGRTSYRDDEERDAELLATILSDRALDRALSSHPIGAAWRGAQHWLYLRWLRPLWADLTTAVPAVVLHEELRRGEPRMRLHRRVVEIRDAILALQPYVCAERRVQAEAVGAGQRVVADACWVEAARRAKLAGCAPVDVVARRGGANSATQVADGGLEGLDAEVRWLRRLDAARRGEVVRRFVEGSRR